MQTNLVCYKLQNRQFKQKKYQDKTIQAKVFKYKPLKSLLK